jgi:WD40 repeat protein
VSAVACEAYDISLLLTGSTDGTVRLWSALTTPAVTTLSRHASVLTVAPDGNRLFSGSHDASLCIWDPNSGMPLRRIAGPYPHWVNAIAASPDGTTLLVGTQGRVLVQAAADGTVRDNLLAGTMVRRCIYSRDGARFATGHDNGVVAVWDARSEVQLWRLEGHQDRIRGLAFGEDPDVLFSGDEKGLVLRWDLKGTPSPTTLCADRGLCRALLLTPGAGSLLCAHENWLRSLDPDSGAVQWERPQAEPLRSLAVLADGSRVLTGSRDGTLTFWDAADGEPLLSFRAHDKDIYALACDPRGQWCATAAEDGRIRIWRRPVPGADAPAIDGAGLLLQVALHYCDELFKREILARRALRIAQTRSDWSPGLRAKVCELLPLHGGSGAWPAIARVFDLLRHPNPPPADLERARGLMEEAAFESTLSKSADVLLQLRTGRYAQAETEAAALLARHPPDMGAVLEASLRAARAMSLHRLGRAAEAGAELEQLRTLSRQPTAALEPVVLAFLDETEAVLGR